MSPASPDPTGHPFDQIREIANDMEAERRATGNAIHTTNGQRLTFDYTNHRGEAATRRVECGYSVPMWAATEWHPEPQWLLSMFCLDRKAWRAFALKDMSNVRVTE